MELSNLKHLQCYMNSFEIDFRRFESQPQSYQLSITFTPSMEIIFETLETVDINMNPYHLMIKPIVNRNFGNTLHHQNGSNQRQPTNKNFSPQYQHITTRQQYQQRNTSQQCQHRNPSQQYQPRSFQRHKTYSIPYLKEHFLGCGINRKGVRELLIQHDGRLENCTFRVPLYIHARAPIKQLLQNNHKHVSRPKEINKIKIHPKTQDLLKKILLALVQK